MDELLKTIFLVDDDALFLKSIEIEFAHMGGYLVRTFQTGEECLKSLEVCPDIIILDYHLNGINKAAMNGIMVLDKVKSVCPASLVIMLSSQDKIEVAVDCMHHYALDYVVKSPTAFLRLHKIIGDNSRYKKLEKTVDWYKERI
ncbi:MAG: response regulator [Flavobacteriales bacterium]